MRVVIVLIAVLVVYAGNSGDGFNRPPPNWRTILSDVIMEVAVISGFIAQKQRTGPCWCGLCVCGLSLSHSTWSETKTRPYGPPSE